MDVDNLAARIKKLRKGKRLSLQKLGDEVGVSKNAVYKWETEQAVPSIKNLSALARAFSVEEVFLAYGVVERKTPHDKLMKKICSLSDADAALLLPVVEEMLSANRNLDAIGE